MAIISRIHHIIELLSSPISSGPIMGIFAHPDDESLLMSGAFLQAHAQGVHTVLVTVTAGELGGKSSGIYGKKLAKIRLLELSKAAQLLNIESIHHLKLPDKGVHKHQIKLAQSLIKIIKKNKPSIVITHDRFDPLQHPDHIATSQAVTDALVQIKPKRQQIVLFASFKPSEKNLTYMLDIDRFSKIKTQAVGAHVSQGLFSLVQLPPDIYYAVNHFEYFIPYENTKKESNNKRHNSNKK